MLTPKTLRYSEYDTVIIGGGPAGLAAALKSWEKGLRTLIIETRDRLGGMPLQCMHHSFGIHRFKEDLTGSEFVCRLIKKLERTDVEYALESFVNRAIYLSPLKKKLELLTSSGTKLVLAKTIIFASRAKERSRYEISIAGPNPAGVMTAGEAQTLMDIYGVLPGKKVLVVGSGGVGLIMARRLSLEGAEVVGVVEALPYSCNLLRKFQQYLKDYSIPLYLSHKVKAVKQKDGRVSSVVISQADNELSLVEGAEKEVGCDTLIMTAGLIPRTKLLRGLGAEIDPKTHGPVVNEYLETSVPGVFAAGNSLLINDYVDYAVEQGEIAGFSASKYVETEGLLIKRPVDVVLGRNMRLAVPQRLTSTNDIVFYGRVSKPEENVWVVFKELGLKTPYLKVMPSIMVRQRIEKGRIEKLKENKLTIEVVPRQ